MFACNTKSIPNKQKPFPKPFSGEMYQKECTRLAGELERHKVDRIKERAQYLMKMMWGTDSTLRNMLFVKWRNLVDHTKKDKMFHQEKTTLERLHGDELER
jgi:hypothetical protein